MFSSFMFSIVDVLHVLLQTPCSVRAVSSDRQRTNSSEPRGRLMRWWTTFQVQWLTTSNTWAPRARHIERDIYIYIHLYYIYLYIDICIDICIYRYMYIDIDIYIYILITEQVSPSSCALISKPPQFDVVQLLQHDHNRGVSPPLRRGGPLHRPGGEARRRAPPVWRLPAARPQQAGDRCRPIGSIQLCFLLWGLCVLSDLVSPRLLRWRTSCWTWPCGSSSPSSASWASDVVPWAPHGTATRSSGVSGSVRRARCLLCREPTHPALSIMDYWSARHDFPPEQLQGHLYIPMYIKALIKRFIFIDVSLRLSSFSFF